MDVPPPARSPTVSPPTTAATRTTTPTATTPSTTAARTRYGRAGLSPLAPPQHPRPATKRHRPDTRRSHVLPDPPRAQSSRHAPPATSLCTVPSNRGGSSRPKSPAVSGDLGEIPDELNLLSPVGGGPAAQMVTQSGEEATFNDRKWPLAGRGGGIRTHDLFVPNEARYQAAPHPATVAQCTRRKDPSGVPGCPGFRNGPPGRHRRSAGSPALQPALGTAGLPSGDGTDQRRSVSVSSVASGRQLKRNGANGEVPSPADTCSQECRPPAACRDRPQARSRPMPQLVTSAP